MIEIIEKAEEMLKKGDMLKRIELHLSVILGYFCRLGIGVLEDTIIDFQILLTNDGWILEALTQTRNVGIREWQLGSHMNIEKCEKTLGIIETKLMVEVALKEERDKKDNWEKVGDCSCEGMDYENYLIKLAKELDVHLREFVHKGNGEINCIVHSIE